jgi:putative DNA primase/helicase
MSGAQRDGAKRRFAQLTEVHRELDRLATLGDVEFEMELLDAVKRLSLGVRPIRKHVAEARKRRAAAAAKAEAAGVADVRPVIEVKGGGIGEEVDAAEAALISSDAGIYQRGELLVRVGVVAIDVSDSRTVEGVQIVRVNEPCLVETLTRAACWVQRDGRNGVLHRVNAPKSHAATLLDRGGRWKLPVLTGVISAPTLRPDGSILDKPGYDTATGLIYDPRGVEFPPVPAEPTKEEAKAALGKIKALLSTFPFVKNADGSVAQSCLLTAAIRRSLRAAPAHCFSAPAAGTGKSKLADMASILATGREAGVVADAGTAEEFGKQLGALLLAGEPVINIDNRTEPLGGALLCQVLTQRRVRIRILGESKMPEMPTGCLVTANGNNLVLFDDMNRRALIANMDAQCERPELREFNNEPVEDTKAQRTGLVVAALTVLRAYHVAGRPEQSGPLGNFEEWSRWVRDSLIWLGEADPADTMEENRRADPKRDMMVTVMDAWERAFGRDSVLAKDVVASAATQIESTTSSGAKKHELAHPDLKDALCLISKRGDQIPTSGALGAWLRENQKRIVNARQFVLAGDIKNVALWRLEGAPARKAAAASPETDADRD